MTSKEQIKKYLNDPTVKACVRVGSVERLAGVPSRTLKHYVDGRVNSFPDKHVDNVIKVLNKL